MTNYYKLPQADLYWKIVDETTTVLQIKNSTDALGITKTTGVARYETLIPNIPKWTISSETEFNTVMTEVLSAINN
jgi:hypothetical protein